MLIPIPNLVLMLLIDVVFAGISAVVLLGSRGIFIINILLGIIGACFGALFPVLLLLGHTQIVDVSTPDYLVSALMGSFILVLFASLFRPANATNNR